MTNTVTVTKIPGLNSTNREKIVLPLPPSADRDARFEMEIYARFMRHLRNVPNSRMEIKILSAIQFTADMLDIREELVAKTLVDLGLLAPRKAFPGTFLDFCDRMMLRGLNPFREDRDSPPPAVSALKEHWDATGENRFGPLPVHYAVFKESNYISH
jgi:hypothetical protein